MHLKFQHFLQNLEISKLFWLLMCDSEALGLAVALRPRATQARQHSNVQTCNLGPEAVQQPHEVDSQDNLRCAWKGGGGNHHISILKHMPSDSQLWYLISKQVFLSKAIAFQGNLILGWAPRFMDSGTICISRRAHWMLNALAGTGTSHLWKTLHRMWMSLES